MEQVDRINGAGRQNEWSRQTERMEQVDRMNGAGRQNEWSRQTE